MHEHGRAHDHGAADDTDVAGGSADRFASTDHLGTEAVAAFVDDELTPPARRRAQAHLMECPACRAEVARQRIAAERLRHSGALRIPADLRARLAALDEDSVPVNGPDASRLSHRPPEDFTALAEGLWRQLRQMGTRP